jgi:type IV pilus assembly protein PilE
MARTRRGFTLIEVMIVVAIVGILAAIAYPMYRDQVMSGNRAEGKAALLKTAQLEERWYTSNGVYTGTLGQLYGIGGATITSNENPALPGRYNIAIVPDAGALGYAQGYTLTATPVAGADTICGNLSLTSTGVRTFTGTGPSATVAKCW